MKEPKQIRNQIVYLYPPKDVRFAHSAGTVVIEAEGGTILLSGISAREARLACEAIQNFLKANKNSQVWSYEPYEKTPSNDGTENVGAPSL